MVTRSSSRRQSIHDVATRTEVLELIKNRGPIDVALLDYRLNEQDTKLRQVEGKVDEANRSINEVMLVLKTLSKDLETHMERDR